MVTKKQFRWILSVYCIIVVCSFIVGLLTESMIPENIREIEPSLRGENSLPFLYMILGISLTLLAAVLVGVIGMFCFWRPSRYIFLAVTIGKIFLMPLCILWMVHTGWQEMFGELELLLDGVILALCFLGPAKHLFEKKGSTTSPYDEV